MTELFLYLIFAIIVLTIVGYLIADRIIYMTPPLIIVIALLLIFPAGAWYLVTNLTNVPREIVVPELKGFPITEAIVRLEELGLVGRQVEEVYDREVVEGKIVTQRPEAGRKVKSGRTVSLVVSKGPKLITVPDLFGREIHQAESILAALDLKLGKVNPDKSARFPPGVVTNQFPVAGSRREPGTKIDLAVTTTPTPETEVEEESIPTPESNF